MCEHRVRLNGACAAAGTCTRDLMAGAASGTLEKLHKATGCAILHAANCGCSRGENPVPNGLSVPSFKWTLLSLPQGIVPKCTYCLKEGHLIKDCPSRARVVALKGQAALNASQPASRGNGAGKVPGSRNGAASGSGAAAAAKGAARSDAPTDCGAPGAIAAATNGSAGGGAHSDGGGSACSDGGNGSGASAGALSPPGSSPLSGSGAVTAAAAGGGTSSGVADFAGELSTVTGLPRLKQSSCSVCGSPDHQKRTCPLVNPEAAAKREQRNDRVSLRSPVLDRVGIDCCCRGCTVVVFGRQS